MQSLRRRGPDAIGFWTDGHLAMAHARLAIIGLDERGVEPLETERYVLAYNGEIYNFLEIRDRLREAGVPVIGSTDAEVLLHAWTLWGREALHELHGFWAFVIYDKLAKTLTLVRDQMGVRPLYYWFDRDGLIVSSMLKTILEVSPTKGDLDYTAMSEYVRYQFTFGDKTFIRQIKKVVPGHVVTLDLQRRERTDAVYEDIFAPSDGDKRPIDTAWLEETGDLVQRCARASTVSDTSFTTFCSGGIDSSLITRLTRPELAYHCNFSDPDCNETSFAKQVVEGTPTRLMVVNAREEFDLVDRCAAIIDDFDELAIGSVILPLDDVLAQVKRRYKVILTGTGGDELFAGYVRYQLALGECRHDSHEALFRDMDGLATAADRFEMAHCKGTPSLYHFYQPSVTETFRDAFAACRPGDSELGAMLRFDRRHFLQGLLNIDDKMCGRHSLESRPTLLHQALVRHMQQVDARALLRNGDLKPVLRDLAAGTLPKSIVQRTDKMGFTTPIGTFVNRSAHRIREHITSSPFRELYNVPQMHFTAEHKFSREVFGLLMLDLWLNRYA